MFAGMAYWAIKKPHGFLGRDFSAAVCLWGAGAALLGLGNLPYLSAKLLAHPASFTCKYRF